MVNREMCVCKPDEACLYCVDGKMGPDAKLDPAWGWWINGSLKFGPMCDPLQNSVMESNEISEHGQCMCIRHTWPKEYDPILANKSRLV